MAEEEVHITRWDRRIFFTGHVWHNTISTDVILKYFHFIFKEKKKKPST